MNLPLSNNFSLSRSEKHKVLFLSFSACPSETVTLSYDCAEKLAQEILQTLNPSKEAASSPVETQSTFRIARRMVDDNQISLKDMEKFFQSEDPKARLQVVRALAKSKEPRGFELVCQACRDSDPRVRRIATDVISHYPNQESLTVLLRQLRDEDKVVRLKAVSSVGKIFQQGQFKSVTPALENVLQDPSLTIRRNAAQLLVGVEDNNRLVSTFSKILKDPDEYMRATAIQALEEIGGEIATSALTIAVKDKSEQVRELAVQAIGRIGNASVVPILLGTLNFDESAGVRQSAAEALGKLGDSSIHKQLLRILKNPEEEESVRAAISRALGKVGTFADIPALLAALKDKSSIIRINCCFALGKIKDSAPVPILAHTLTSDNNPRVRCAAAKALGEIGGTAASCALQNGLNNSEIDAKIAIIKALATFHEPEVVDALMELLDDPNSKVQEEVKKSLGRLNRI